MDDQQKNFLILRLRSDILKTIDRLGEFFDERQVLALLSMLVIEYCCKNNLYCDDFNRYCEDISNLFHRVYDDYEKLKQKYDLN